MPNMPSCERNRLDSIIDGLERLYRDAHEIFDSHCAVLLNRAPYGTSFGAIKRREIFEPAGTALDYVAALKHLNKKIKESHR
jgi:hypothetical protein